MPEPHRIALFFGVTELGGAELGAREYAAHQPDLEHRALFLESHGPAVDYYREAGIDTACLDLDRRGWLHAARELRRTLTAWRTDLVHAFGLRPSLLVRLLGARPPLVQAIHSVDTHRSTWQAIADRLTAGHVDRYIANSEAGREFVIRARGVARERTAVVPNGIDVAAYACPASERLRMRQSLGIDDATSLILTVANLRPPKGLDILVEVAARLEGAGRRIAWLVAGDGPDRAPLAAELAARGLESTVRLLGFRRDVAELYAAADVVCLTSRREGVPVSILEAMSSARPVVATRVGGIAELVIDGVTGLLAEPEVEPILDALAALLDAPERRAAMGAAAQARARAEFDIERAAGSLAQHYAQLIAAHGRR